MRDPYLQDDCSVLKNKLGIKDGNTLKNKSDKIQFFGEQSPIISKIFSKAKYHFFNNANHLHCFFSVNRNLIGTP